MKDYSNGKDKEYISQYTIKVIDGITYLSIDYPDGRNELKEYSQEEEKELLSRMRFQVREASIHLNSRNKTKESYLKGIPGSLIMTACALLMFYCAYIDNEMPSNIRTLCNAAALFSIFADIYAIFDYFKVKRDLEVFDDEEYEKIVEFTERKDSISNEPNPNFDEQLKGKGYLDEKITLNNVVDMELSEIRKR